MYLISFVLNFTLKNIYYYENNSKQFKTIQNNSKQFKTIVFLINFFLISNFTFAQFWVYSGDTATYMANQVYEKYKIKKSDFKKLKFKVDKNSKEFKKLDSLNLEYKTFDYSLKKAELNSVKIEKYNLILQTFETDSVEELSIGLKNVILRNESKIFFISDNLKTFAGPITFNSLQNKSKLLLNSGGMNSNTFNLIVVNSEDASFELSNFSILKRNKEIKNAKLNGISPSSHCYQNYNNQSYSVGRVNFFNRGNCTFTIINNELQNRRRLALTARHCIASNVADLNLDNSDINLPVANAIFEIPQRYLCNTSNDENRIWRSTGATYLGSQWPTDFLIVELQDPLPVNVSYQGWDRTNFALNTNVYSIHNPAPLPYNGRQVISFGLIFDNLSKYKVNWTTGETKPGSSGGALFNNNNRIIGGLSFGLPPAIPDNYFKLSNSWTTSPYGLKQFLSPNLNLTSMNTLDPLQMNGPQLLCFGSNATVSMPNLLPGENMTWTTSYGLNVTSSTFNSVTVAPINSSFSGQVTVTASYNAFTEENNNGLNNFAKNFTFWVGKPQNSVTNLTTNSTSFGSVMNFSASQTNVLSYNNQSLSTNINWTFPSSWSKSGSTGSPISIYTFSGAGPFSVNSTNTCGTSTNSSFFVNQVAILKEKIVYPNVADNYLNFRNYENPIEIILTETATGRKLKSYDSSSIFSINEGEYSIILTNDLPLGVTATLIFKDKKESYNVKILK